MYIRAYGIPSPTSIRFHGTESTAGDSFPTSPTNHALRSHHHARPLRSPYSLWNRSGHVWRDWRRHVQDQEHDQRRKAHATIPRPVGQTNDGPRPKTHGLVTRAIRFADRTTRLRAEQPLENREAHVLEGWPGFVEGIGTSADALETMDKARRPYGGHGLQLPRMKGGIIIQPPPSMLNANTEYL